MFDVTEALLTIVHNILTFLLLPDAQEVTRTPYYKCICFESRQELDR
jgi:hypothetical protein